MKFVSTFEVFRDKLTPFAFAFVVSFVSYGQSPRPIALSLVSQYEKSLIEDLNSRIPGVQTIQIEAITANPGLNSRGENFVLVANAIKAACSKSVHTYSIGQTEGASPNSLLLKAEILPSKGNDIVTFIIIRDKTGLVLFSEIYSLKGKNEEKPLPTLFFATNVSIQPSLENITLANQGFDTLRQNFSATLLAFSLTGSQYALGRRDLTFGYTIGLMYTVPTPSTSSTTPTFLMNLLTGVSTELLLKEFNLFNVNSYVSWNASVLTDLSQLNLGRYNISSGMGLYVSRNFSLRSGLDLCNRSVIPWQTTPLGLSNFDRLYIGIGLGF